MRKSKILAIDDDKFFRELYEDILISEGFSITTIENGRQGLNLLGKEGFDIVITDMIMPDWDGIRTMEEIKKAFPDQDIIIVTHISEIETAVEAMKSGASDYILKPIKREDLLYAVRKLLKRQKILLEHSVLIKENVEYFEILSIYKKCLGILSVNEYTPLIDAIIDAMTVESGAKEGYFWFSEEGVDGQWEIRGATVGDLVKTDRALPVDNKAWTDLLKRGVPFFWPDEDKKRCFVPIMPHGKGIGVADLSGKKGGGGFDDKDMKFAGIIAEFSQIALNNAKKIHTLTGQSYLDNESGTYSLNCFEDNFKRQLFLASRYKRSFSLVYFKIDNIEDVNDRFGSDSVRRSIKNLLKKMTDVLRESDIIAKKKTGEYYILLPETDYFGSIMTVKRIEEGIAGYKFVSDGEISQNLDLLIVSASYPRDGSRMESFLNILRERSAQLKSTIIHRLDLSNKNFWESVGMLLDNNAATGKETAARGSKTGSPYVYSSFAKQFYNRLKEHIAEELRIRPYLRGVLFIGMNIVSAGEGICKKFAGLENLSTRIFVLGKQGDEKWKIPNITPVYLKENESPVNMLLFLNEESGYAFFSRSDGDEDDLVFHTSDIFTVEKLISKLQDHYLLQWI